MAAAYKLTYNYCIITVFFMFPTWLSDGMLYTSESKSMVQALNGTAWLAIVLAALQWTLKTSCSQETMSFSCGQQTNEKKNIYFSYIHFFLWLQAMSKSFPSVFF